MGKLWRRQQVSRPLGSVPCIGASPKSSQGKQGGHCLKDTVRRHSIPENLFRRKEKTMLSRGMAFCALATRPKTMRLAQEGEKEADLNRTVDRVPHSSTLMSAQRKKGRRGVSLGITNGAVGVMITTTTATTGDKARITNRQFPGPLGQFPGWEGLE